ncbi:MAG: proton-conducting transporter membrane subunit [Myxococcales bacterium]|nr:proton-conducting transporter membrane subunit [Myxococcales bacterium]
MGLTGPGPLLILQAFGIKAAFPLLHNWLQDAYPDATVTAFLSAFTTKLAIDALARGFAGTEILIYIGATMTVFPIFFAVIENGLRRVLAYSLNNQFGFIVVGIGTELSVNGIAAHAFAHILYKALPWLVTRLRRMGGHVWGEQKELALRTVRGALSIAEREYGPRGPFGEPWLTGRTAIWTALTLVTFLLLNFYLGSS